MEQQITEFLEQMKKKKEESRINSRELGRSEGERDAMALTLLDLAQLQQALTKEWAEKSQIDQADLYRKCRKLITKRQGKGFRIQINKESGGQGLEGKYSVSIIEPPDNTYEKLVGMRKEDYLEAWFHRFMDILDEVESKVGFPGIPYAF